MDNKKFNVKGEGYDRLLDTLQLAFHLLGEETVVGYRLSPKKGMMLYSSSYSLGKDGVIPFVAPLTPEQLYSQVTAFLESDFTESMKFKTWDRPVDDSDVESVLGWRIYTENWGRIGGDQDAFLAITPSYSWYGK